MKALNVECIKCGYKGTVLNNELAVNECPICGAKGTLQLTRQHQVNLMYDNVKKHVLAGFKLFGVEKTLELIEDATLFPPHVKDCYAKVIEDISGGKLKIKRNI